MEFPVLFLGALPEKIPALYSLMNYADECRKQTYLGIERGISLNPILNSFQRTVDEYDIDHELIDSFFNSMQMDLFNINYDDDRYKEYIYGSAEAVGLMCLKVFCEGNQDLYDKLKINAGLLGAAFQKVNFLRDMKADYYSLSRTYFPYCDFNNFTAGDKDQIETDIAGDFSKAYQGILKLPRKARFGVYVAYKYYLSLFKKIKKLQPETVMQQLVHT